MGGWQKEKPFESLYQQNFKFSENSELVLVIIESDKEIEEVDFGTANFYFETN